MNIQRKLLATASIMTMMACATGAAFAQQAEDGEASGQEASDVIVVTGIRGALFQALETKRDADTIGEAISADDIGTLPALDLAEALQVIPGVQVNRENDDGQFRYGEISLRGLPGSFTNTTANGQSLASSSGSVTPSEGVPNAFGAFSSRVFDGVWVNKTSRADLVEGGIAGTVDMRLADALARPDGQFVISAGGQYEELPDEIVANIFATGTHHLIEDRLAVTFRAAYEEEAFRRDAFNFTGYGPLGEDSRNRGGFVGANGETFDEWKAANGIAPDEDVLFPNSFRQYAEGRDGYRFSFVGGAEFQATPDLRLGADILYSDRELDLDAQWLLTVASPALTSITPTSDPFAGYTDANGGTVWIVPGYDYEDIIYSQSSRAGTLTQETRGLFLDAEYTHDRWTFDGSVAFSEAEFARINSNYQAQYQASNANNLTDTNGTFGSINSGSGNSDNYLYTLNFDPNVTSLGSDLGVGFANTDNATAVFVQTADANGILQRFFSAGNEVFRNRTDRAINFNAERELDLGLLRSVKFGARHSEENVESFILFSSIAGLNVQGLTNDLFVAGPGDFFGGGAPGANLGGEWEFIDVARVEQILFANGVNNPNGFETSPYTGAIYRRAGDAPRGQDSVASTDTTTTALYAMANFEGQLAGFNVGGNFGVRHIRTELDGDGFGTLNGQTVPTSASSSYEFTLPSFNGSIELLPDLYVRIGYSEGINRPNPAGFTPSTFIEEIPGDGSPDNPGRVNVDLPGTRVEPYTSNNYDLSIEWYNRRGSLFSAAFYRKDVNSFIDQRLICPADGLDLGFGTLSEVDMGGGQIECRIDADNREIRISESFNFDTTITIDGVELALQQNLDFLDNWFLAGFGVQASAAFVDVSGEQPNGDPAFIPRISDESYNVAGYWENDQFSARLAYNWRSEYFLPGGLSITGAEDRQVAPRGQLDFITRYDITDDLTIDFRVFNILEVEYEEYQSNNPMMNRQTAFDGRTFSSSLTYKF